VRADPPLDRVTTASLPALRKVTAASHAMSVEADHAKAAALFREAIALDSTFAGAYRGLATALGNMAVDPVGQDSALARAYRYRDRLTERERLFTTATYFTGLGQDRRQAAAAYEGILALDSTNAGALNNYGLVLVSLREFDRAEVMFRRAFALRPAPGPAMNLATALRGQGRLAAAESTLTAARARWPEVERVEGGAAVSALEGRLLDSAAVRAERLLATGTDPSNRAAAAQVLAVVAFQRGQPDRAARRLAEVWTWWRAAGDPGAPLEQAFDLATIDLWTRAPGSMPH
jgi:tetratricopeptide (TPR) repeat protein